MRGGGLLTGFHRVRVGMAAKAKGSTLGFFSSLKTALTEGLDVESAAAKELDTRDETYREKYLLDYSQKTDILMTDMYTDQTHYGGETICNIEKQPRSLRISGHLKKEREGLLLVDFMFAGLRCHNLIENRVLGYNGIKVEVKPNNCPLKVCIDI